MSPISSQKKKYHLEKFLLLRCVNYCGHPSSESSKFVIHPPKLLIAAHLKLMSKKPKCASSVFNAAWAGVSFCILHDPWPENHLQPVATKATNRKQAPRKIVEKQINEAYAVINIYLIVLISFYCISCHYGENTIFTGMASQYQTI